MAIPHEDGPPVTDVASAALLSPELLEEFEGRLRQQGWPVESLGAGLSEAKMDELASPHAVRVPAEARVWWAWHDASTASASIIPGRDALGLERALEYRRARRRRAELAAHDAFAPEEHRNAELLWSPSWLPLLEVGAPLITIDCDVPEGGPSPLRNIDWSRLGEEDYDWPIAPSLGAEVADWLRKLDNGEYRYCPHRASWHRWW